MKHILLLTLLLLSVRTCGIMPFEDVYVCKPHGYYCNDDIGITYEYDAFHANMLYGNWQCSYNMLIGAYEIKEIKFFTDGYADIILCERGNVNRMIKTFKYSYNGTQLLFGIEEPLFKMTFYLAIRGYRYPELMVYDANGEYTLKKND